MYTFTLWIEKDTQQIMACQLTVQRLTHGLPLHKVKFFFKIPDMLDATAIFKTSI